VADKGIFILAELAGEACDVIAEIQREFDPKLAAIPARPHVTLTGSSGVGPIDAGTPVPTLQAALAPIASATLPMALEFGAPMRFMQTNVVVLPLNPHGELRALHEKIARCGLPFERARFRFTPHVTLSLYPTLDDAALKRLLATRVRAPAELAAISAYLTYNPARSTKLLELRLGSGPQPRNGGSGK
jgi:2'-5' RNA ligase